MRIKHRTSPLWLHHKARLYKFSPLLNSPVAYNVNFTVPAYMRMLLKANGGNCTFTLEHLGETKIYSLQNGEELVLENVWQDTIMKCSDYGQIFVDLGHNLSNWGIIAGVGSPTPPTPIGGWGVSSYGASGWGV